MKLPPRVHVELGKKDRHQIMAMLRKGRESARVLRRALILRQLDQGQTGAQVSRDLGVARKTVRVIARRYEDEELGSALYEKPRPGKPRSLNPSQNQRVIAMVCSPPPAGQARWSVRLIAEEAYPSEQAHSFRRLFLVIDYCHERTIFRNVSSSYAERSVCAV